MDKKKFMSQVVKDSILNQIERFQQEKGDSFEFDICEYFLQQQNNIVINFMIGQGQSE